MSEEKAKATTRSRKKTPELKAEPEQAEQRRYMAKVKAPLNLRAGPGGVYPVAAVMPKGQKLLLTGDPEQLLRPSEFVPVVTADGSEGWVCNDFIEVIELV